mmetsp:Transcript_31252/g.68280  ORF Transcript_31252/g.68280 Transcript_31252/m.68280 type:complete len:270 (+) Transcript_31252:165-974(+)
MADHFDSIAIVDHSANTVTLLVLEHNLPFVRVLVDASSATSASDVQADLVTYGDGRWSLETSQSGHNGTVRVDLPLGVSSEDIRCKFRKRIKQVEVQTPLSFAAAFSLASAAGDVNALELLYDKGHMPEGASPEGVTPLIAAASKSRLNAIEFLLSKGDVDIDAQDRVNCFGDEGGRTALYHAVWNCNEAAVRALIDAGASTNIGDLNGETPLMVAARTGHAEIVRMLLESKADLEKRDDAGWSALEKAKARGHIDAVETIFNFRFSKA